MNILILLCLCVITRSHVEEGTIGVQSESNRGVSTRSDDGEGSIDGVSTRSDDGEGSIDGVKTISLDSHGTIDDVESISFDSQILTDENQSPRSPRSPRSPKSQIYDSVHGDPYRCYVGGIIESDCQLLINESVLQKYISQYKVVKKDYVEDYDLPYRKYSKPKKRTNIIVKRVFRLNEFSDPHFNTLCKAPGLYLYRLNFKNKEILKTTANVVLVGTDIYKLKYHSRMIHKFQVETNMKTPLYYMYITFMKTGYNTATTYYFTRNYEHAMNVIDDGIEFLNDKLKVQFADHKDEMKEIMTWSVLYHTLMIDILNNVSNETDMSIDNNIHNYDTLLLKEEQEFEKLLGEGEKYPNPYILMYRKYFLDEDLCEEKIIKLEELAQQNLLTYSKEYNNINMFSIYYELVAASIQTTGIKAFKILTKAICNPVKSTEDRLLNYKANQMAKEFVENCIDENGWIIQAGNTFCDALDEMRHLNSEFNENSNWICLDKMLTNYTQEQMQKTVIERLQENVNSNENIDENILHAILRGVIDMDTGIRRKKVEILKKSVKILEKYITNNESQCGSNELIRKNVYLAYKWSAEFFAVQCKGLPGDFRKRYEQRARDALKSANGLRSVKFGKHTFETNLPSDDHLQYLNTKLNCRKKNSSQNWEKDITKLDGWVFIYLKLSTPSKDKVEKCLEQLFLFVTLNHPYIHKSDALVNIYRFRMENSFKFFRNSIMSGYLQNAMSIPVISAEDRYRNKVAHELYSMHLIHFNLIPDRSNYNEGDIEVFNF